MSDDTYPDSPGYQDTDTSRAAASAIKPGATTIRAEVARLFEVRSALTADECAERLDMSILTIRPRVTELVKQGELVDTGQRRKNRSGRLAAVYRAPTNADRWNAAHYVGQVFFYFPVRGELPVQVRTRSEAWETHGGDVIVMVEGRSGGVSVEHLQPVHPQEPESAPEAS